MRNRAAQGPRLGAAGTSLCLRSPAEKARLRGFSDHEAGQRKHEGYIYSVVEAEQL